MGPLTYGATRLWNISQTAWWSPRIFGAEWEIRWLDPSGARRSVFTVRTKEAPVVTRVQRIIGFLSLALVCTTSLAQEDEKRVGLEAALGGAYFDNFFQAPDDAEKQNVSGLTGLLFPAEDLAGLISCTNRLLENADLASRMGDAARKKALVSASWKTRASGLLP